MELYMVDT